MNRRGNETEEAIYHIYRGKNKPGPDNPRPGLPHRKEKHKERNRSTPCMWIVTIICG
jgi:hypothetical protein